MAKWSEGSIKTYKVVGWYHPNPIDTSLAPTQITTLVKASNKRDAFDKGEIALAAARINTGVSARHLMNWYVEEVQS